MILYTGINGIKNKSMINNSSPDHAAVLRQQLGEFIRIHRQRIAPDSVGFQSGGRRRTPGLRREELAQLCRVSVTWITWLEQGREVAASAAMLARLAQALLLTSAERAYLFELATRPDPEQSSEMTLHPLAPVLRSVEQMACPAYVLDRRWDVVAANTQAKTLFLSWGTESMAGTPNLLRFLFFYPQAKLLIDSWEMRCSRLVAEFRADCGGHNDDPLIRELLDELCEGNNDFYRCWQSQTVLEREGGERRFHHPQLGEQVFEQLTMRPALHKDVKTVMLLPVTSTGSL
jgi:transcriptional regulator with XRE-family HTH domain